MGDVSISKVYQFLSNYNKSGDWAKAADKNENGIVSKLEAYTFLDNNFFKSEGLTNSEKEDIFYKFWKTMDTDTEGKVREGSKVNDKGALNEKEINDALKNIQIAERIDDFVNNNISGHEPDVITNKKGWLNSVKDGITEKVFDYIDHNIGAELTDAKLKEFYELTCRKATAKYYADELTGNIAKELGLVENKDGKEETLYKSGSDEVLTKVINSYIESLNGDTTTSIESIIAKVKELVEAYKDTAVTNSKTDVLEPYGYDIEGDLNALQVPTLKKSITEKIVNYIKSNYSSLYKGQYAELADSVIESYVNALLSGSKAPEFITLQKFDISMIDINKLVSDIKSAQAGTRSADPAYNMDLSDSDKKFNGQTISFILSNPNKNAVQLSGFQTWSRAKATAKNSIRTFVNSLKTALSAAGYDSEMLEKAAKNTILYYNAVIDSIQDQISSSGDGMKEVTFNYVDADGKSHTESSTFSQKTRCYEKHAGRTNAGALNIDQNSTGIRMNESYSATNTYEFYLNSAVLIRKFQEFFGSIVI